MNTNFKVDTTLKQFISIRDYLDNNEIIHEIKGNPKFQNLRIRNNVNIDDIKIWLFNGWNTERVLRVSSELFKSSNNHFVLQWSFPQSYYSIFQVTQSFIYLIRDTKLSHKSIMNRFSELVRTKWYPETLSFYCDGTIKNQQTYNIKNDSQIKSSRNSDLLNVSHSNQINQLLKSTRRIILGFKLQTMNGRKRYFTDNQDKKVTNYLKNCSIRTFPINFGRYELEEFLIEKHNPILNRKGN